MKYILITLVLWTFGILSSIAQIKVACVGNSITYGAGIEGRDSLAYPQQLAKILGNDWIVKNFGNSGSTLLKNGNRPYWDQPEYEESQAFLPDVVIIKLGTNDSKPMNWGEHGEEFKNDYLELIRIYENLESNPVIYLGIPIPVVEDTWGIRKKIVEEDIATIILEIAKEKNLPVIDFKSVLSEHQELIPDKIHPDSEGSKLMAEEVSKILFKNTEQIKNR